MSKRWLTGLPISIGKSYELFVNGQQVAHLMHAGGSTISTFALLHRTFDPENLQRDTVHGVPGLDISDRVDIRYILNRCYLIDNTSEVSIYACQEHGSPPDKKLALNILQRIGRGLERRLCISVPHLVRPGSAFNNSPPQAISDSMPDVTCRGTAYAWLADNVRWETVHPAVAKTWHVDLSKLRSIQQRAQHNLGFPAKIIRTALQTIS